MNMPWYESSLSRLEARLRELIEGEPGVEGIERKFHKQLEQLLTEALRSGVQKISNGANSQEATAPDLYTLLLPTQQAEQVLTHPAELDRLTQVLKAAAYKAGICFASEPVLRVVATPQSTETKILVEFSQAGKGDTHTSKVESSLLEASQIGLGKVPKAFLIVNGVTTFPLTEAVVNIGRDSSNQVHLDDQRVSRLHAQLRLIQGQFVIFDLDSTGGTFVNDVAISSHLLNPGDVIRVADVPLVYGLEEDLPAGYTQELPVDPPAPELL
jgi:hypothetical protein